MVERIGSREARFEVLDRIRQKQPDVSYEEIARDIARAVAEARGATYQASKPELDDNAEGGVSSPRKKLS